MIKPKEKCRLNKTIFRLLSKIREDLKAENKIGPKPYSDTSIRNSFSVKQSIHTVSKNSVENISKSAERQIITQNMKKSERLKLRELNKQRAKKEREKQREERRLHPTSRKTNKRLNCGSTFDWQAQMIRDAESSAEMQAYREKVNEMSLDEIDNELRNISMIEWNMSCNFSNYVDENLDSTRAYNADLCAQRNILEARKKV